MSKLRLNKGELRRLDQDLATYRRYLPALELRRQQLIGMRVTLQQEQSQLQQQQSELDQRIAKQLPMLAETKVQLQRMVEVRSLKLNWENIAGIRLPRLESIRFDHIGYDLFASPVWLDTALELAEQYAEWMIRRHLLEERRRYLERAIAKTTQRVNLFEQVLIPNAERDRRKIQLFLSDEATNAVVRAKIAKRKVKKVAASHLAASDQSGNGLTESEVAR